jgi:hypothetical protein
MSASLVISTVDRNPILHQEFYVNKQKSTLLQSDLLRKQEFKRILRLLYLMFLAYVFVTCSIRDDWTFVVAGHAFNDLLLLGIICTQNITHGPKIVS